MDFTEEQLRDIIYLLYHKYDGDYISLMKVWEIDTEEIEMYLEDNPEEKGEKDETVPTVEELTKGALRQLRSSLQQCTDPQRVAKALDTLNRMTLQAEKKAEEQAKEEEENLTASITTRVEELLNRPVPVIAESDTSPVVREHTIRQSKKRKVIPSKEVNGLNENSDTP